ncbi:MAG: HlyC/CorC family transporter [Alphaproteobacteria bacterium]|nr:HlyC/CorC family transporter [Alphaproteobacteria bacterium]
MSPEHTPELLFYGVTIFLFLLISAVFSAAETAMTAVSRARIYQLVMDGNKRAQLVSKLRREKEAVIGTVLLGNNAVNIAASAIATSLTLKLFGAENGLVLVTVLMTLLVVVFTEVLPKTYAIQNAERVALAFAGILNVLVKILYPITKSIQLFIRMLLRMFGVDINKGSSFVSATDVIRGTIELHHREGKMIKQDRDMLGSILDLNDIEIADIMVHRKQVETINADLPASELINAAVSTMHSRIPLWRGEPDNIIGLLHVKNLIKAMKQRGQSLSSEDILAICNAPWFVPETTTLRDQLLAFRSKRQHFAFVVDEYGGWEGVVTLEDIIEEIVGDIDDEHDEEDNDIYKVGDAVYLVSGDVSLRDINRQLDWDLPDDDASTVAGLLIHEAQTIPSVGESFTLHGYRFTVIEKSAAQLTRLRIERLEASGDSEDDGL